jgi:LPS-assembly protein
VGDDISILSDKAYRKTSENLFEAVGNVVITHFKEVLYGESASFKMDTGDVNVKGNVRYIGPGITMYGSSLDYNTKNQFLSIQNARISSSEGEGRYSVVGKTITRISPTEYVARDAEYSTCRDCPESWSIFGEKVKVTIGEYVRIRHALLKVKGVTVMYLPYIVLPIKKKRQTGLLFPKFSINLDEDGVGYKQPWFWAISDQTDMLFAPATFGKRGLGNEVRFRHYFGEKKWSEIHSMQARDRIYDPADAESDDESGTSEFRHFTDYEQHFSFGNWFNHHGQYSFTRDLDVSRDYDGYTSQFVRGSEIGGGGWMELRQNIFDLNAESYLNRNNIFNETYGFDDSYVQIMPQVNFQTLPLAFFQTDIPMLQYMSFDLEASYAVFKQNKKNEGDFIRNAHRSIVTPKLNWQLFTLGPFSLKTLGEVNYNHYNFFRLDPSDSSNDGRKRFEKVEQVVKTEFSFEIDKIFGIAFEEKIPLDRVNQDYIQKLNEEKLKEEDPDAPFKETIGTIPRFDQGVTDDFLLRKKNSYRHAQEYKLVHNYIADETLEGNENFKRQIQNQSGWFDYRDSIRSSSHTLGDVRNQTSLSQKNTIELQWNNTLIKKSTSNYDPYKPVNSLRDNFNYNQMAYFNISQGYEINNEPGMTFSDKITRLYVNTGLNLSTFRFSLSEYYFWQDNRNIVNFRIAKQFPLIEFSGRLRLDSLSTPKNKEYQLGTKVDLLDVLSLQGNYVYDLEEDDRTESVVSLMYKPRNDCWRLQLVHTETEIDTSIAFNFFVNFSGNNFVSLTGI